MDVVRCPRTRSPPSSTKSSCRLRVLAFAALDDAADGGDERLPGVAALGEDLLAGRRQTIVTAPSLPGLLDPLALEPAARLEAIEERIERRDVEPDHAARPRLD